jgi:hypothetical protein
MSTLDQWLIVALMAKAPFVQAQTVRSFLTMHLDFQAAVEVAVPVRV